MGILILLPLAGLMLVLIWLSLRRRRRLAAGLPVSVPLSDRLRQLRALWRRR
ncbi:hypothetical protein [Microterricola viridarii]|uniref:hypothetical protein n=1 Tax=Microterricola viridarii TaxID=412690 RepID=UPI0013659EFC|nr:hypothetical protein [Microterricola viridarii]